MYQTVKLHQAKNREEQLIYPREIKVFVETLHKISLNNTHISLHSACSRRAAKAANAKVNNRLLQIYGRCISDPAKNNYRQDVVKNGLLCLRVYDYVQAPTLTLQAKMIHLFFKTVSR